jgi:hypothetical protein
LRRAFFELSGRHETPEEQRMNRIIAPAAASVVVGLLLGAAAIFGITLMVQQDSRPPLPGGDPQSSVLNKVEYGNRS